MTPKQILKTGGAGFTLLEFSIMLFIMLLIFSFALPSFNVWFESPLLQDTKKIAKTITGLKHQAILTGQSYRIVFDTAKSSYQVFVKVSAKTNQYQNHPDYSSPIALTSPVQFHSIRKLKYIAEDRMFEFESFEFEKIIGQTFNFNVDSSGFLDLMDIKLRDETHKIALAVVSIMGKIEIGPEEDI